MTTPSWARPSDPHALREQAVRCLQSGCPATVIEVAATQGSAPREAGARMLVTAAGEWGTVGGGHLEQLAIATARARLQAGFEHPHERHHERHFALGPSLGQCCGGAVTLRFTRLTADALSDWPEQRAPDRLCAPEPPRHLASLHDAAPHVQLHGAGHVGRAIVAALAPLPFSVQWVDERDAAFPVDPAWFAQHPRIQRLVTDDAAAEAAAAPPGTAYLVLTHRHDLDLRIVQAILRRGDFAFCGLIGSRTKRQRFLHRLAERGLPAAVLDRMTCPIGLPTAGTSGPQAKWPEVIAAGVAQQLLALVPAATAAITAAAAA